MILEDVARRADFLIEATAPSHTEVLRHRDLHVVDVIPVPDRLEERIGKPEVEQVLHRLLAEKVIDAIDRGLGEELMERPIEGLRRGEVAPKGFFHDQSRLRRTARLRQSLGDGAEQAGRDRQVEDRALCLAERLPQSLEGRWRFIVAGDVRESTGKGGERAGVEAAVCGDAVACPLAQLLDGPVGLRHADHGHVEMSAPRQRLKRRKNLFIRQVAGRAEEHKRVGINLGHGPSRGDSRRRMSSRYDRPECRAGES